MNYDFDAALDNPELGGAEVYESEVLEPVLMDLPEAGEVLVSGDPFSVADQLDDNQGDNVLNAQGDCGVVSIANIVTLAGQECSEDDAIVKAVNLRLCNYSPEGDPSENGGTNVYARQRLLAEYGIPSTVMDGFNAPSPEVIAQYVEAGHGVNLGVNAGYAWNDADYIDDGQSNHSIIVTGTIRDPETNELKGLIVCDSGLPGESSTKFLSIETLDMAYVHAPGSSALITDQPIR